MLVSDFKHAEENDYLSERMRKAFAFLRENSLDDLECGRHAIDGDDIYANVMEYDTVPSEMKKMEAHRNYYDVQYVVYGEEVLEYSQVDGLCVTQEYDEESDCALYEALADATKVTLHADDFVVVAPEDAHKPGCARKGVSCHVKKVVVKVRK